MTLNQCIDVIRYNIQIYVIFHIISMKKNKVGLSIHLQKTLNLALWSETKNKNLICVRVWELTIYFLLRWFFQLK